jgi:threonine/homoserine/homoserine lactone efflux protein
VTSSGTLIAFLIASLPLACFPGQSVAFIVAQSLSGGRRTGILATLGVETGYLVHVAAAAIGVSAIVAASATAFNVVRVLGALWLAYLAVQSWRHRRTGTLGDTVRAQKEQEDQEPHTGPKKAYRSGLLVGSLNPKTALFYLAFLPQFVRPHQGPIWLQSMTLGICFILLAMVFDLSWSLIASSLRNVLRKVKLIWIDRGAGTVYGALAAVLLSIRR